MLARARGYLADVFRALERAPVEAALALYVAVAFSVAIEIGDDAMQVWFETAVAALLVLAAAWTGTLLQALGVWRARTRWLVTGAGAALVALYAWRVLDTTREAEAWRAVALLGAGVLWLVALPAFGRPADAVARMRRIDGRVLLRLMAVLLYALALFAGLSIALAAINTLFELKLEGEIYGHVFGWIFLVLVPWVIFGGLDDYVRPPGAADPVAAAVHRLTLYLVPPLLALYFLILYAYMVRIGVTGEVPKNLVSPLVLAAGTLTALALLLFDPQPGTAPLGRALRLAPPLLLPLVPLGAWAIFVRIDQYGWTEFRALRLVLLGAFTALALLATLQLWRRRPFALHVLPLVLAGTIVLAVLGPWGVLPLARRSQQARLDAALAHLDSVAPPRTAAGARIVPGELYDRIRDDARYLQRHFGREALPPELARHAPARDLWIDYAQALGLERAPTERGARSGFARRLPADQPVAVRGGTLYRIEFLPERNPRAAAGPLVTADSLRLLLHVGDQVLHADLAVLLAAPAARSGELSGGSSVVALRDAAGEVHGELVVFDVRVGEVRGRRGLQHLTGVALLRSADR